MASDQQIKSGVQKRLNLAPIKAVIVNGPDGSPNIPGFSGLIWVAMYTASGLGMPIAVRFSKIESSAVGTPVLLGYDDSRVLSIINPDFDGQMAVGINPISSNVLADPNVTGNNFINQYQLTTLWSGPVSAASDSMLVTVQPWPYVQNGTFHLFLGGDGSGTSPVDLTSYIPGSADTQCLAVLFVDDTDMIEVQVSTPIPTSDPLSPDDVQECVTNASAGAKNKPVIAYRLYHGQTNINSGFFDTGGDVFLDMRNIINVDSASSLSVTDGSTTVSAVTTISFTGATVTDAGGGEADVTITGSGAAPADATYITQTHSSGLSAEQAMGDLATGLVKNTTTTGVQSIAAAGTDYTSPTGTENLQNKTITASSLVATALSLIIGGFKGIFSHSNTADRTYTLPDYNGQLATLAGTETLTNKSIAASEVNSGQLALAQGGTHADLSGTGGAHNFLKQSSSGADVTVGTIAAADLPNTTVTPASYTNTNLTVDAQGRITAASNGTDNGITQLTGDVTAGPGSGSQAATVATVGGASAANVAKAVAALADKFILQTPDATNLPNAQALSALATGLLKNTTTTGVLSIAATPSDYLSGAFYFWRQPARVASISNVNIASAPSSIDSVTLSSGNRILLFGQSTGSQNGLWVFNGAGSALTRPTDYAAASTILAYAGITVYITEGTIYSGSTFYLTTTAAITIDTTSTSWTVQNINLSVPTIIGILSESNGGWGQDVSAQSGIPLFTSGSITFEPTTGSAGNVVLSNSPTIVTPTIASFTNATHNHTNAAGGGQLTDAALSSAVGAAKGGTSFTSYTKGDLIVATGSTTLAKQGVGTDGMAVIADSSLTNGLGYKGVWVTLSANNILGGNAASFDLTSIPSGYSHLKLFLKLRSDKAASTQENVYLRMNNDSTAGNYYSYGINEAGATVAQGATERLGATGAGIEFRVGCTAATATSGYFSYLEITILDYAVTTTPHQVFWTGAIQLNNTTGNLELIRGHGLWTSTSAISRLTLLPVSAGNFVANSSCMLMGAQ